MSAALINRSLTTIRTELEFLYDSEVIDKKLMDTLVLSLPQKYAKDMQPWGIDKISLSSPDSVAESLAKTSIQEEIKPRPAPIPPRSPAPALGYCKVLFNYDSQQPGDLQLQKDDRVAVVEHLSPDWWKGYKQADGPDKTGVFPSNYVSLIPEAEFQSEKAIFSPEKASYSSEKASYSPGPPPGPPTYQNQAPQYDQLQQQPSYGGYAQFPPPSSNYYPPQQYSQPQQQYSQPQQEQAPQEASQSNAGSHMKKFGSKLGNAAIFGAGATIGSDIVNLIF